MRIRIFQTVVISAYLVSSPALSEEICYERSGQFAKLRHCVTSVRAAEGGTNFGPEHLAATDDGAWCASVEANQTITLGLQPRAPLRTVMMTNGYAKSADTFRQNGRVKRAMIETDRGYKGMIVVRDSRAEQRFIIAKGSYAWVRLTILESYRGSASPNICLSEFLVNLEELADK